MKKNSIYAGIAALMMMVFSHSASAVTMGVTYNDNPQPYVNFTYGSMTGGHTTEFGITLNGDGWSGFSTIGYCVDLDNTIGQTNYTVTLDPITSSSGNYLYAAWLMDQSADAASGDSEKTAGLQLAIWEAVYGDNFTYTPSGSIGGYYTNYYQSAMGDTAMWSALRYDYAVSDASNTQDLLIRLDPVPEPGTMLLLGLGMIGLGAVGRKRYTQE